METNNSKKSKLKTELMDWVKSIVVAVIIAAIILYFVLPSRVKQHSMENTLKPGQFIFASTFMYDINKPETGDIALMKVNYDGTREKRLVKRIIAVEGQHIVIKDGTVTVDGQLLVEEYIKDQTTPGYIDIIVPAKHVFVMGDNRLVSIDSRSFGTVPLSKVYAKVFSEK